MSEPADTAAQSGNMLKGVISLAVFAAVVTLAVSFVEQQTRERRELNRELQAARIIGEVLPGVSYDNAPGLDFIAIQDAELLGTESAQRAYIARIDGQPVAMAISLIAPAGYVGPITLLVGIGADGRILTVRALEHRETPGLGDRIDIARSDWIRSFDGGGLNPADAEAWNLRRDGGRFDHLSGATITSRAVVRAVHNALRYAELHPVAALPAAQAAADSASVELVGESNQ